MYCENCGALRQAGNAFCVSCGTSLGAAGSAQGGAQSSFGYGDVTAVATQDNPLAVRLATIACWLAFASAAFWFLGAGYRLANRGGNEFVEYLKYLEWWTCVPLVVAAGMLLALRKNALVGAGFLIGTSVILYITFVSVGAKLIEHEEWYGAGPVGLNLVSAALAIGALGCVSAAVIQAKPKFSMPSTELTVVACLAATFGVLNLVLFAYGRQFWSFDLIFLNGPSAWYALLRTVFAIAIVASIAIGCMMGGRAAASVAIVGATYFGLHGIQALFYDHSGLALGFYFGVLACGAFIATAVIASSIAKREMQPALLDPSLLAR